MDWHTTRLALALNQGRHQKQKWEPFTCKQIETDHLLGSAGDVAAPEQGGKRKRAPLQEPVRGRGRYLSQAPPRKLQYKAGWS